MQEYWSMLIDMLMMAKQTNKTPDIAKRHAEL